jgi:hypothetical protein
MARENGAGPVTDDTVSEARKDALGTRVPSKPTSTKQQGWRDVLPVHPAAEMFPLMSEAELRELGEDIKANGLKHPIALWTDGARDQLWRRTKLLDGRNRLDALEAVGVCLISDEGCFDIGKVPSGAVDLLFTSGDESTRRIATDPYAYVVSTNLHRRHLTAEQRRDLIAKLLKATPEKSNRQIAETVKVDHKTVASVRAEKEATGEIPQLNRTVGKDGKARRQPARKPPSPAVVRARGLLPEARPPGQTVDRVIRVHSTPVAPSFAYGIINKQQAEVGNNVDPQASADERKAEAAVEGEGEAQPLIRTRHQEFGESANLRAEIGNLKSDLAKRAAMLALEPDAAKLRKEVVDQQVEMASLRRTLKEVTKERDRYRIRVTRKFREVQRLLTSKNHNLLAKFFHPDSSQHVTADDRADAARLVIALRPLFIEDQNEEPAP